MAGPQSGGLPSNCNVSGINSDRSPTSLAGKKYRMGSFSATYPATAKGGKVVTVNTKDAFVGALDYIARNCAVNVECNKYFKSLPKGITIGDIMGRNLFFFELHAAPGAQATDVPAGYTAGFNDTYAEIGINPVVLGSKMELAQVIVHEFAHVAGAPGREEFPGETTASLKQSKRYDQAIQAERALTKCFLHPQFDPDAWGARERLRKGGGPRIA